jgi:hypothetical protein
MAATAGMPLTAWTRMQRDESTGAAAAALLPQQERRGVSSGSRVVAPSQPAEVPAARTQQHHLPLCPAVLSLLSAAVVVPASAGCLTGPAPRQALHTDAKHSLPHHLTVTSMLYTMLCRRRAKFPREYVMKQSTDMIAAIRKAYPSVKKVGAAG